MLTKEEIRELRNAKRIVLVRTPTRSYIKAVRPNATKRDEEVSIDVPVENEVHGTSCGPDKIDDIREFRARCFCYATLWTDCGSHGRRWQTIAQFLRRGDVIFLHWGRGYNTTDYLREVGLIGDRLDLQIRRGEKRFEFSLEVSTTPPDSTARMIRNGEHNTG